MHESATCLVQDGKLTFACAEERLSRRKQDASFPVLAIQAALRHGGLKMQDIDHVAIGWPRPAETYAHNLKLLLTIYDELQSNSESPILLSRSPVVP